MSAPILRSTPTSGPIGRRSIRSDPVRTQSTPSDAAKSAVRKRIAVPAGPTLTSVPPTGSPADRIAERVAVSSQLSSGSGVAPAIKLSTMARVPMLLLGGSATVVSSISSGGKRRISIRSETCYLSGHTASTAVLRLSRAAASTQRGVPTLRRANPAPWVPNIVPSLRAM